MIYYWMTCGLTKGEIVGIENKLVYRIGKSTATKTILLKDCTFERIPDHHPVQLDYPALLQTQGA